MAIAAVILAAGASTRMGRPKMLLPFGGATVLACVVKAHLEAGLDRVVVVLGHEAERVRGDAGLPDDSRLRLVVNPQWSEGMGSSIRCGVAECGAASAVVLALGDQPGVTADRVRRLLHAWVPGVALVLPMDGPRASHPVVFGGDLLAELATLGGDTGAREVVRRHQAQAVRVTLPALADIDTDEDYRVCLGGGGAGSGLHLG